MNTINLGVKTRKTFGNTKFNNLAFSDNGLILKYRNKQEIKISYEELDKVYIKNTN